MNKRAIWDALIGLALALGVGVCYLLPEVFPALEKLELRAYDERSKIRQDLDPPADIVIIAIDETSLDQLGRWPWPRSRVAEMIDKLSAAGPKVIGLNMLFSEPEQNQGILEIKSLETKYMELLAARKIIEKGAAFSSEFSSATVRMDSDSKLLTSLQNAKNVVLPLYFNLSSVPGNKPKELPEAVSKSALAAQVSKEEETLTQSAVKASYPIEAFAEPSLGAGHVNIDADYLDGVVRRELLAVKYDASFYPSYALQLVLAYLGIKPSDAVITPGSQIQAGQHTIPLDAENKLFITFRGPEQTFRYYSFHDVTKMEDSVLKDNFADKIVILGLTAPGLSPLNVTPVARSFAAVEIVANVIENILSHKFLRRPPWALNAEAGLLAAVGLFIMLGLPRLKALWGAVASIFLLVSLIVAGTFLFVQGEWIKITYPCALMTLGYLVTVTKRFLITEKAKELVEASSIDQARMLGLSFQGNGQLDIAFDNFRKCPLDENMAETFYNLGGDFERKRQYAKAVSVYKHIETKFPKYKDITDKIKVLSEAAEGAVFGGIGGAKKEGTVMISGGTSKPTLGRYQIEKELGRGAMGIVYLGKDPKMNRMVAIKTMMLDEGSDAAQTKEIKERFFREAESAGNLNHPNIIRIFDVGEEADVSYIAMELLDGKDLVEFTAKDKMLPTPTALEYVALVADALDYAHANGIVHRDIKPANIMLLKDGTLRVADFGIARITASSKTATGTVMGTPSYMSPEQVAGKKVDGRSDLFSLTVALFELLTGEKPFKGGEGIGTLLFQIANDPHPDPQSIKPDLPAGATAIINKGMAKDPEQRYARGSLMAADIRALLAAIKSGTAPAAPAPIAVKPTPEPQYVPAATLTALPISALPAPPPLPSAAATIPVMAVPMTTQPVAPINTPDDVDTISAEAFSKALGGGAPTVPPPPPPPVAVEIAAAPVLQIIPIIPADATLKIGQTLPPLTPPAAAAPPVANVIAEGAGDARPPALTAPPVANVIAEGAGDARPPALTAPPAAAAPVFAPDATIRLAPPPSQDKPS